MKIGIDISQIIYGTGVSVYTKSLVENLLKMDKKNDYILFGGSLRQKSILQNIINYYHTAVRGNSRGVILPIPPTLADFLWNRLHILPIEKLIGKVDVFHSSDWVQPPTKAAKVTTIHDFGFIKYPDTAHPKIKAVMTRRFKWIKREVDLIIAISETTKKDIIEILEIPKEKIRVVYEAAPTDINQIKDKKIIDKVKKRFGIKADYLLSVATLEPRKNLKRIIQAFKILASQYPRLSLVVAGKSGWDEEVNRLTKKKLSRIIFTDYINREIELAALYSGASCFVFPSLYEGFGLPVLEAMKCGCPVITSNVSSLPEVAGEAAFLVDPLNVEEIARGIKKVIGDKKRREMLVKKGFAQVKKFSWEKTARQTLKVYQEAIKK